MTFSFVSAPPATRAPSFGRTSSATGSPFPPPRSTSASAASPESFLEWGEKKGSRIALISENRWEWGISDFAILAIGAVNVPIYPTLTGEQIAVLLEDAGCRTAIVSTRQQFDKLNAVRSQTQLERILIMDSSAPPEGAIPFNEILAGADAAGSQPRCRPRRAGPLRRAL